MVLDGLFPIAVQYYGTTRQNMCEFKKKKLSANIFLTVQFVRISFTDQTVLKALRKDFKNL